MFQWLRVNRCRAGNKITGAKRFIVGHIASIIFFCLPHNEQGPLPRWKLRVDASALVTRLICRRRGREDYE